MLRGMATESGLGTRIKRARERRRWTQRQLADALRVNIKTVDNWENGRTSPRSSIGALEEVLGVRLNDETEPESLIPPRLLRAIMDDDELTGEQRRAVIAAIEQQLAKERAGGAASSSPAHGEAGRRQRPAS